MLTTSDEKVDQTFLMREGGRFRLCCFWRNWIQVQSATQMNSYFHAVALEFDCHREKAPDLFKIWNQHEMKSETRNICRELKLKNETNSLPRNVCWWSTWSLKPWNTSSLGMSYYQVYGFNFDLWTCTGRGFQDKSSLCLTMLPGFLGFQWWQQKSQVNSYWPTSYGLGIPLAGQLPENLEGAQLK